MTRTALAEYVVFTTLLVITPGSATAVVVRNVLGGGRSQGFAAAGGVAFANLTYAILCAFGLAAALAHNQTALLLVELGGASYLMWLGTRSLRRIWAAQPGTIPESLNTTTTQNVGKPSQGFVEGLATNLANVAVVTFYLTVVPSFAGHTLGISSTYIMLAAIQISLAFVSHSTWVLAIDAMRSAFSGPRVRHALDGITGIALILLAGRIVGVF